MAEFEEALAESHVSTTEDAERDYQQIAPRLNQDGYAVQPLRFVTPGQLAPRAPQPLRT